MIHRISETFLSLQGEAYFAGVPSIFIRYVGCTLRCPGFSRPKEERSKPNEEVAKVISEIDKYKKLEELPLVKTGCDSYPSVYPEFRHLCHQYTTEQLIAKIDELVGSLNQEEIHLVFTGGEPLLHQVEIADLLYQLNKTNHHFKNVTFETNGTVELKKYINFGNYKLTFSISPKLSISGEPFEKRFKPDAIQSFMPWENERNDVESIYFKFVVATEEDVIEATEFLEKLPFYESLKHYCNFYLMPVGGTKSENTHLTEKEVADLCIKYGFWFSLRTHLYIYGNAWNT